MQSLGVSVVADPFVQCQLAGGCLTDANMSFASEDVEISPLFVYRSKSLGVEKRKATWAGWNHTPCSWDE